MTTFKIPVDAPDIGPVISYLQDNNCPIPTDASWSDVLDFLDECNLWAGVGDVFREIGLIHSFDPTTIPLQIKQQLDYYKEQITSGERDLTCEEAAKILEEHGQELCTLQQDETFEPYELTAEEALQNCMNGSEPVGTCSERARRYAAEFLYLNPECSLESAEWSEHIEVFYNMSELHWKGAIVSSGDRYNLFGLSDLFLSYYDERIKKGSDPSLVEGLLSSLPDLFDTCRDLSDINPSLIIFYLNSRIEDFQSRLLEKPVDYNEAESIRYNSNEVLEELYRNGYANIALKKSIKSLRVALNGGYYSSAEGIGAAYRAIEEEAKELLAIDPWSISAYMAMADVRFDFYGDVPDALDLTAKAIDMGGWVYGVIDKAFLERVHEYEEVFRGVKVSEEQLQSALITSSEEDLFKLGVLFVMNEEQDKAREVFSRILELNPYNKRAAMYLLSIIDVDREKGNDDAYFNSLQKLSERFPKSLDINRAVVVFLLDKNRHGEAKEFAETLSNSADTKLKAIGFFILALLAGRESNFTSKLALLEEALKYDPDLGEAYIKLAYIKEALGVREGVEDLVMKARELDPLDYSIYETLGDIYLNRGDLDEAEKWLSLAIRLNRDSIGIILSLGEFSYMKDNVTVAEGWFNRALEINPSNETALSWMAIISREQERPEYKDYLARLEKTGYRGSMYYYTLGRLAEMDMDMVGACRNYEEARLIAPGINLYLKALERLE